MKRQNREEVYPSSTRRTPRGKRLLSWLLSIVLLLSLLPGMELHVHADYEDGAECPACGHYHWDEYMCGVCGACSENCTQTDCWLETTPVPIATAVFWTTATPSSVTAAAHASTA